MTLWLLTLWVSVQVYSSRAQYQFEYSESVCQRPWFDRLYWSNLQTTKPTSDVLRTHILMGKPVRAIIRHGKYKESLVLENLNMNGQVICGESSDRMSFPVGPTAEMQPVIVCTEGSVSYLNVSVSRYDGAVKDHKWTVDSIMFRTRDYSPEHTPVTSRYLDGSTSNGFSDNFLAMAIKSEMRGLMRDRGYAFTMDNVHIDYQTRHISGQSLGHISQAYTNTGGITFRERPYHWLSSWETTGRRDSARWSLGNMTQLNHTNDFVALQWFADSCWAIVYEHDKNGTALKGSLEHLTMYIRMGHRVRVHFDGYTIEASSVFVSPDGVIVAQTSTEMARRGGSGPEKTFFNTKTRQVYRLVHTTGIVRSFLYFVENGKLSAKSTEMLKVTWSVDTRPWSPAVIMDQNNNITMGNSSSLVYGMDTSSVRVKVEIKEKEATFAGKNSELFLEINNIRSIDSTASNPEVIGQSLKTLPFYRGGDGRDYHLYLYKPVKQYVQVSTKTGVTLAANDMATRAYVTPEKWLVESITWYQDERLY
ncbi:uncharacterized protein LOC131945812 [Physella acuta]|uniref:uncharacterized protein LOC131945812 n=1 Tax=Physella acuta TaxID=109671 RepID=UPI0027DC2629|nr:uncharacterized protein LOC131945812 [Physella acuta]